MQFIQSTSCFIEICVFPNIYKGLSANIFIFPELWPPPGTELQINYLVVHGGSIELTIYHISCTYLSYSTPGTVRGLQIRIMYTLHDKFRKSLPLIVGVAARILSGPFEIQKFMLGKQLLRIRFYNFFLDSEKFYGFHMSYYCFFNIVNFIKSKKKFDFCWFFVYFPILVKKYKIKTRVFF